MDLQQIDIFASVQDTLGEKTANYQVNQQIFFFVNSLERCTYRLTSRARPPRRKRNLWTGDW